MDVKTFSLNYGYGKGPNYVEEMRENEFPQLKGTIYLDHTGATLYSKSQIGLFTSSLTGNLYGNPHSHSSSSILSTDLIDNVRQRVARYFNTTLDDYDVIFTSGATGSLKLLVDAFQWKQDSYFCYLNDNHTSVIGMREMTKQYGTKNICLEEKDINDMINGSTKCVQYPLLTNTPREKCGKADEVTSLFAYPAMSNFCGRRYPLDWIKLVQNGLLNSSHKLHDKQFAGSSADSCYDHNVPIWFVLLDSASHCSSSPIDLATIQPDFLCLSFYKLFGFPTGLGALLVSKRAKMSLTEKKYYGGGTVLSTLTPVNFHVKKTGLSDRFEDGTVDFLNIIALKHGFDTLEKLCTNMEKISQHTFCLARYTYCQMNSLTYENGQPLCTIYTDTEFENSFIQGPIIVFNLRKADGDYYGYSEVEKLASLKNIQLRTGCFCNTGDCQKHLNLTTEQMMRNYEAGHVCGDSIDLIDNEPTGSVRISFGYMSNLSDANAFLQFLVECFLYRTTSCDKTEKSEPFAHFKMFPILTSSAIEQYTDMLASTNGCEHGAQTGRLSPLILCSQKGIASLGPREPLKVKERNDSVTNTKTTKTEREAAAKISPYYDSMPVFSPGVSQLKRICLYPVKSCGAFEVEEWQLGLGGLVYDRCWMIVTESGVSLTQKREPRMCMIKPKVDLINNVLVLTFQDYAPLRISLNAGTLGKEADNTARGGDTLLTKICPTRVCGDRISCYDCGDLAANWLTDVLSQPCRLLRQVNPLARKIKDKKARENDNYSLSLSNVSQFLLVSYRSVHRLYLDAFDGSEGFVSEEEIASFTDQFRANFIIDTRYPFEEDTWDNINIGKVNFKVTGKSVRCQMICINQATGEKSHHPLKALSKLRGTKMEFGIYLAASDDANGTKIRVSDIVTPAIRSI